MITIVDVIRAYSQRLEEVFGAPPVTKDLIEVRDRPCTVLTPVETGAEPDAGLWHDTFTLQIVFFAPFNNKGYLDLLQARGRMTAAVRRTVELGDAFHLVPEDIDVDLDREEMLMTCQFSVECWQVHDDDLTPDPGSDQTMETLEQAETWKGA